MSDIVYKVQYYLFSDRRISAIDKRGQKTVNTVFWPPI